MSQDTLCQNDATQLILLDSALGSKLLLILLGSSSRKYTLDSIFIPTDTGWYPFELTVKLGRRKKQDQAGFYVLPRPYFSGSDTIDVCQESNTFYFVPEIQQCSGCAINFPNASSGLDSVQLTITKDTLYTFSFENTQGCDQQQSVWFDYHPTPLITAITSSLTICDEDTVSIGYRTKRKY